MIKDNREYRALASFEARQRDDENDKYIVEGYASTFEPYVLFEDMDGTKYSERIDEHAFDSADMSDVIFLYNHEGRVYARKKNGSLDISTDSHGLKIRADLSGSAGGRELYEDIRSGLIDQMSFAFTVREDAYDKETHTRSVLSIAKVFDVSAVSIPANDQTSISCRSYFDGVIEAERAERLEQQKKAEQVERINKILGVTRE